MKNKLLTGVAAGLLCSVVAFPAAADVFLDVDSFFFKNVFVDEDVNIEKRIIINVEVDEELSSDAEAQTFANITNQDNRVDAISEIPTLGASVTRQAGIGGSVNDNTGGIQVNQATGNMQNQANLVSFGLTGDGQAVTDAVATVDQVNTDNSVDWFNVGNTVDPTFPVISLDAVIIGSVNGNVGIVGVNQDTGNMNNQTNAVAVAVGIGGTGADGSVALAESDLGQENAFNTVEAVNTTASALIGGSVNGNFGIVHVNQSGGNMSNQANVVSVSITLGGNGS